MPQNVLERRENDREDKDCNMSSLFNLVRDFGGRLTQHMQDEAKQDSIVLHELRLIRGDIDKLKDTVDSLTVLQSAFPETPDGDLDLHGHRHYHTAKIKAYNESAHRWHDFKAKWIEKTMDAAVIGAMILIGYGVIGWVQATTNVVVK